MTQDPRDNAKKPFSTPQVVVYGNVLEITRAVAGTSGNDNAKTAPTKSR